MQRGRHPDQPQHENRADQTGNPMITQDQDTLPPPPFGIKPFPTPFELIGINREQEQAYREIIAKPFWTATDNWLIYHARMEWRQEERLWYIPYSHPELLAFDPRTDDQIAGRVQKLLIEERSREGVPQ